MGPQASERAQPVACRWDETHPHQNLHAQPVHGRAVVVRPPLMAEPAENKATQESSHTNDASDDPPDPFRATRSGGTKLRIALSHKQGEQGKCATTRRQREQNGALAPHRSTRLILSWAMPTLKARNTRLPSSRRRRFSYEVHDAVWYLFLSGFGLRRKGFG